MAERVQINEIAKPQYTPVTSWVQMNILMDEGLVVERYLGNGWEPLSPVQRPSVSWFKMVVADGVAIRQSPNQKYMVARSYEGKLNLIGGPNAIFTKYGRTRESVMMYDADPHFVRWLGGLVWSVVDEKVLL